MSLQTVWSERSEPSDREGVQFEVLTGYLRNLLHVYTIDIGQHIVQRRMPAIGEFILR